MLKCLILFLTFLSLHCQASEQFWSTGVSWLKQSLPEHSKLELRKAKISFKGCRQRDYQLLLTQYFKHDFFVETSIAYASGKLNWGAYHQKISVKQWSFVPYYYLSERVNLGLGIVMQAPPEFKTSQGEALQLPKNLTWLVSSRIQGLSKQHYMDVSITRQQWQSGNTSTAWFERRRADNKLNIAYQAFF
ncbi:MAG: hypothetical protein ACI965_000615 [Paraglaciecola sp.]|jgi:hypothetical protein